MIFVVGEEDELRALLMGASDLEKKLQRALDEILRLSDKTEKLIKRQQDIDEQRRLKLQAEAEKNEALRLLIQDLDLLDNLLKDLTVVRKQYVKAEGIHRNIQKIIEKDDIDEIDTDELVLDGIRVDTQSATDKILKIREDILKVQDNFLLGTDDEMNVVDETANLKGKIGETKCDVTRLGNEIDEFLMSQNSRYMDLLKKKTLQDEEEKKKREQELRIQEEIDKERLRLENERKTAEEEERRRRDIERIKLEAAEKERLRLQEVENKKLQALENARKKKDMEEKMLQLEKMLDEQAEKNLMKQKAEILSILDGDTFEIERMKGEVLILVDKQKKIGKIRTKRRTLYTIPEEEEIDDEQELRDLIERTARLFNALLNNEKEVQKLRSELESSLPDGLLTHIVQLEKNLQSEADNLLSIQTETEICHDRHNKRLEDGFRAREEDEERRRQLESDEKKMLKMKEDMDLMKYKQSQMKKSLQAKVKTEEEEKENKNDMIILNEKEQDISSLELEIFETSQEMEAWKNFTWPEGFETEMNKFGMIGSLSMPSFPDYLIQNPDIRAAIQARKEELQKIKEKISREAERMQEICDALEEMERRRKEAELKRLADQALQWTKDYIPSGPAEFGAMPVFR